MYDVAQDTEKKKKNGISVNFCNMGFIFVKVCVITEEVCFYNTICTYYICSELSTIIWKEF